MEMNESQKFFEENKFVVIRNLISADMALLFYEYTKTVIQSVDCKIAVSPKYDQYWDGGFGDAQVPDTFYRYGDPLIDTLMMLTLNKIQEYTGLQLVPNYTYWRFYQKGDDLKPHTDRGSCEISSTLCLGYNISNVDQSINPDYDWPMFVKDQKGNNIPVHMKPGDCIIYRGIEVEHWRDKFIGLNHSQAFIHYNDVNGPVKNYFDGRHILGIPKLN
jgi:hypothetical protein